MLKDKYLRASSKKILKWQQTVNWNTIGENGNPIQYINYLKSYHISSKYIFVDFSEFVCVIGFVLLLVIFLTRIENQIQLIQLEVV